MLSCNIQRNDASVQEMQFLLCVMTVNSAHVTLTTVPLVTDAPLLS